MSAKEPNGEERAYHEAGHALIAHSSGALRLRVSGYVSIVEGEDEFGGGDVEPAPDVRESDCRLVYETGVIAAAGWAAQRRHLLETRQAVDEPLLRLGAAADLEALTEMFGSGVFNEFATIAECRFDEGSNWAAVQSLVKKPLELRKITAADAKAILDL